MGVDSRRSRSRVHDPAAYIARYSPLSYRLARLLAESPNDGFGREIGMNGESVVGPVRSFGLDEMKIFDGLGDDTADEFQYK